MDAQEADGEEVDGEEVYGCVSLALNEVLGI